MKATSRMSFCDGFIFGYFFLFVEGDEGKNLSRFKILNLFKMMTTGPLLLNDHASMEDEPLQSNPKPAATVGMK